jgi:hypothetical protein
MALVIEDGSGTNQSANSYQSTDDLIAYAALRGLDLSNDPVDELEVHLVKAMDYLEGKRSKFKGYPTASSQPLQWPRRDVWGIAQPGLMVPVDEIPRELRYGQLALAVESYNGIDLQPNRLPADKGAVISEKVEGAVEVKYESAGVKRPFTPALSKAEALLSPLYKNNGLNLVRT